MVFAMESDRTDPRADYGYTPSKRYMIVSTAAGGEPGAVVWEFDDLQTATEFLDDHLAPYDYGVDAVIVRKVYRTVEYVDTEADD